jgi:hypothetical protein
VCTCAALIHKHRPHVVFFVVLGIVAVTSLVDIVVLVPIRRASGNATDSDAPVRVKVDQRLVRVARECRETGTIDLREKGRCETVEKLANAGRKGRMGRLEKRA